MSRTFLLTFNPNGNNSWNEIQDNVDALNSGEVYRDRYSCGNNKSISYGDRIFIIRLGGEPRGIFASGYSVSDVFFDEHWDKEKRKEGKIANYIIVDFDYLANFNNKKDMLLMNELKKISEKYKWSSQISGIEISEEIAEALEKRWKDISGISENDYILNNINCDEIVESDTFYEGAVTTIKVNKYERNKKARETCLKEYGYTCSVCGINMEEKYGELGKNKIHVHHLKELHTIKKQYKLNAKEDLRPVCANCHSIIHSKRPAYAIEEVKSNIIDSDKSIKGE